VHIIRGYARLRLRVVAARPRRKEHAMSVARITEISAGSPTSFEDAIRTGVDRANKTLRNVRGAWVKEQQVVVENEAIKEFRVNLMVTFVLDD
jgi:flavin-binding protein dodecin